MFGIDRIIKSRGDATNPCESAVDGDLGPLSKRSLPVRDEARHDRCRNAYFAKGQFLARQERWDMLGRLIDQTDQSRFSTPSGVSLAGVLADGARADAVRHARSAIDEVDSPLPEGIRALAEIAEEHPDSWAVQLVVARAQIDCAWAYEGQVDPYALPCAPTLGFLDRFAVAADLVARAAEMAPDSVEIAATVCDLLAAQATAETMVDECHHTVIAADPQNPGRLRAYGVHLLPRWFGSFQRLAETTESVSDALDDVWGNRAYTWLWFDALRLDPEAAVELDAERFVAGLHEILSTRADPHLANLLAAYADSMKPASEPEDLSTEARRARSVIHAALPDLTDRHLTELHPQVWARADCLPGAMQTGPLSSGRIAAATAQARGAVDAAIAARAMSSGTQGERRA